MAAKKTAENKEEAKERATMGPPPQPEGKTETRLFQINPDTKVWLTKNEARDAGFYWRD